MKIIKRILKWLLYKADLAEIKLNCDCPHCKFIENISSDGIKNNREYWLITEIFIYLHDGKDYCTYILDKVIEEGINGNG